VSWRAELERAAGALRRAAGAADRAERLLAEAESRLAAADTAQRRRHLAERLRAAAETAASGWLGDELHALSTGAPVWADEPRSGVTRIGTAELEGDPAFPALADLLGSGHLVVDRDAADPRVAGLLQALLVRFAAAYPKLELVLVDGVTLGQVFAPATPLVDAGIAEPVATDHLMLGRALTAAEKRLQEIRDMAARGQSIADRPYQVIVVAGMPPQVGKSLRARAPPRAPARAAARSHAPAARRR
jgi:DNA segregation ATPase FtsK/SpoIIIE, S-DNA-T family